LARIGKGEGTGSQLLVLSSQLEKDEERCLSRANFHRDAGDFGDDAGNRRFKVEFERFAEIARASSSALPWLATSTWAHWAMKTLSSFQT